MRTRNSIGTRRPGLRAGDQGRANHLTDLMSVETKPGLRQERRESLLRGAECPAGLSGERLQPALDPSGPLKRLEGLADAGGPAGVAADVADLLATVPAPADLKIRPEPRPCAHAVLGRDEALPRQRPPVLGPQPEPAERGEFRCAASGG